MKKAILLFVPFFFIVLIQNTFSQCPSTLIADTSASWYKYTGNSFVNNFNGPSLNKTDVFHWHTEGWSGINLSQSDGMLHMKNAFKKFANVNLWFDSTSVIDVSATPFVYFEARATKDISGIEFRVIDSDGNSTWSQYKPSFTTEWQSYEYDLSTAWNIDISIIDHLNWASLVDTISCVTIYIRHISLGDTSYKHTKYSSVTNVSCPGGSDGAIDIETENGVGTYEFTWTTSDGSGLSPSVEDQTGLSAGTYKVVVKDGNGCLDSTSYTVNDGIPPVANAGSNESICSGDTTDLQATGGCSYLWSTGDGLDSIAVNPGSSTTYSVTVTDSKGCMDTDDVTVTVNPLPTASITPNPAKTCVNDTLNLDGNPSGGAGTWSTHAWTGDTVNLSATNLQTPQFTSPTTGTYNLTYTVTDDNGCIASDAITITVNDNPTVSVTSDPAEMCAGDTINIDGNPSGGSGSWTTHAWTGDNGPLSATNIQAPEFTTLSSGAYNLTYTVTDDNGCSGTDDISVTVNSNPSASVAPDPADMCAGDTLDMDGNPSGGSGSWTTHTWTGDTGPLSAMNIQAPEFTTLSSGTYNLTYTVTDDNGCSGTDDISVTVNSNPSASVAPNSAVMCADDTLDMDGNPSGGSGSWATHTWTGDTVPLSATNIQTPEFTTLSSGTYNLTYTVKDINGCTDTDSTKVVVNPRPTAEAGDPDTICEGGNILLRAFGGDSYQWEDGPAEQIYDINNLDTTTLFIVTAFNTYGCSDTDSVLITVNPLPNTSDISGDAKPPCNASDVTYSVDLHTGAHYSWSVPPNAKITSDTIGPGHNTITVDFKSSNGDIKVLETSPEGCTGTQKSLAVYMVGCDLNPEFNANNTSICFGDTVTFTNWSSGETDTSVFEWDFGDGAIPSTATDTGLGTTEYKVFYSTTGQKTVSLNVYEGKKDSLIRTNYITVNSLPDANAGANSSICQGDTIELTATGGTSYEWQNQPDIQTISVTPADSTLYFVTVTDANGCQDNDSVYVYVNPLPTITANDIDSLFYNSDTVLTVTTDTADYSYNWSPADMLLPDNDTLSNPNTVNLTNDQTYTVIVTNNQTGCYSTDNVHVRVTGVPLTIIAGTDTAIDANVSICFGEQILLTAFPSGGTESYTVKWDTVPLNDASLLSNNTAITVSPDETTTYVVEADDGKETNKDSITVFVNPLPVTSVQPEDTTVVSNATVPLYAEGGTDYLWQPEKYLIDDDTLQSPRAQPVVPSLFIVRVTNQYGCHAYDTIIVDTMACRLWVPEAFTPNEDQVNDIFKAEGFGIDDFNMILFNRWGEQIFESNSLDVGWDGSLNDNTQHIQSVGYLIKATCQDNKTIIEKKGNIYIVK